MNKILDVEKLDSIKEEKSNETLMSPLSPLTTTNKEQSLSSRHKLSPLLSGDYRESSSSTDVKDDHQLTGRGN